MQRAVYLGLGTNLGNKRKNLERAIRELERTPGIKVSRKSSVYWSEPWGYKEQEDFLNQVVEIETDLPAPDLLHSLKEIEINMGRQHGIKWGPRIIDIDILLYGDEVLHSEELQIPHAHMRERLFVLVPLQELNEEIIFPDDGTSLREVLVRVLARERNNLKKI